MPDPGKGEEGQSCGEGTGINMIFEIKRKGGADLYKYLYVESKVAGILNADNHRELIDKYSSEGWRFVAAIPKSSGSYGQIKSNDLVFEKFED